MKHIFNQEECTIPGLNNVKPLFIFDKFNWNSTLEEVQAILGKFYEDGKIPFCEPRDSIEPGFTLFKYNKIKLFNHSATFYFRFPFEVNKLKSIQVDLHFDGDILKHNEVYIYFLNILKNKYGIPTEQNVPEIHGYTNLSNNSDESATKFAYQNIENLYPVTIWRHNSYVLAFSHSNSGKIMFEYFCNDFEYIRETYKNQIENKFREML